MENTKVWRQYMVALIANIVSLNIGIAFGWTSPNIPKLQDELMRDTPLKQLPTPEEISWIGPLVPLGAAISPFLAGPVVNVVGPKYVIITSGVFFMLSYILLGVGNNLSSIYAARFIQGCGVGVNMFIIPIYIGEIAQDKHRGRLGTFLVLFFVAGILLAFSIGPYVPYKTFQFMCFTVPCTFIVLFTFMPESPFYLLKHGHSEQTINSMKFLRGTEKEDIMMELNEIKKLVETSDNRRALCTELFKHRGNRKALIICITLMWIQQFSGINAVIFYAQPIFEKAGQTIKPEISSIIISCTQVLANCCTTLVIERFGRKIILFVSNVGMAIAMCLLGLYFYLDMEKFGIVKNLAFLPITSLIAFMFIFSVGFGPIPWLLVGELFSSDVKSTASMIISSLCWAFAFLVTKYFNSIDNAIGTHWTFWIFTFCLVIGIFFTQFYVFETKGLSLQQIQDKLKSEIGE